MSLKKGILAAACLSATVFVAGCGRIQLVGSGTIVTETPELNAFSAVSASHEFDVTIVAGPVFGVVVRADDNVMPHVEVGKNGDTLDLDLKESSYRLKNVTLEAEITMPKLLALRLSGASSASVSGFKSTEPFDARLSGASELEGTLFSGRAEFRLSGASSATLAGAGGELMVQAAGASGAKLSAFTVTDAEVEASGASSVEVNVSGTLDASASGASKVVYSGKPTLGKTGTSGASSINAK
jgi:hypothetical protein